MRTAGSNNLRASGLQRGDAIATRFVIVAPYDPLVQDLPGHQACQAFVVEGTFCGFQVASVGAILEGSYFWLSSRSGSGFVLFAFCNPRVLGAHGGAGYIFGALAILAVLPPGEKKQPCAQLVPQRATMDSQWLDRVSSRPTRA